ncbi:MAG: molybdenum cofactor guanylyltransferase [Candidatus Thorarchaeota archaeon]|jgi:molybdopterin-guanine dinucleotide biosynthesis protein A
MDKITVAILAGGTSKRFGSEKALAEFQGKPLVAHMVDIAHRLSTEIMIVVSDESQEESIRNAVPDIRIVVDPPSETKSALAGALTAFEYTLTKHLLLLPVDAPLASTELLRMLLRMCEGHGAVVPSWPSGYIEPLHSVYLAEHAYYHGLKVIEEGKHKMRNLLDRLQSVLYVSTETLKQFDSELNTFKNFNTPKELKTAEKTSLRK